VTISDGSANGSGGGIEGGAGVNVALDDVDLTDNFASANGGGVYVGTGILATSNCSFADNYADSGGGAFTDGTTSITGGFFQGNVASAGGGALSVNGGGTNTVAETRFTGNVGLNGGAIDDEATKLSLQYCTIDGNHAFDNVSESGGGDGGGLYISDLADSSVTIANCLFLQDAADNEDGGAISQFSGSLSIQNSQLSDNRASSLGGAIAFDGATTTITGTTIDDSRSSEGGAIYFGGTGTGTEGSMLMDDTLTLNTSGVGGGVFDGGTGALTLLGDTVNANDAGTIGGGIELVDVSPLEIGNTIVAQNIQGGEGGGNDVSTFEGTAVTDLGGNLIGNGTGSVGFTVSTLVGTATSPINPQLGPLLDNGSMAPYTPFNLGGAPVYFEAGATGSLQVVQTEALLTTSLAFGSGVAGASSTADARGFPRPAAESSIGAYQPEYTASASAAQVYVEKLYELLLNRTADSQGLNLFAPFIVVNGDNASVVQSIENTPEYHDDQIALFYKKFLARTADSAGVTYFTSILNSGGTLTEVQALILGSAEYADDHGLYTVNVVESIYENVLNRIPMTLEVDGWVQSVADGTPLTIVASDILFSQEDISYLIMADYPSYLGRKAAATDVAFWVGIERASNDPKSTLNDGILGSPEAFSNLVDGVD
jgi:hypothetical protein